MSDNPPVFPPTVGGDEDPNLYEGALTLRDYFAAAALPGLVKHEDLTDRDWMQWTAQAAFGLADAMLKEREK